MDVSGQATRFWRHVFVVIGGLLAFWGVMALVYLRFFRVPQRTPDDPPELVCDFGELYSAGACTSPMWIPVVLVVVGGVLALVGALAFRSRYERPEDVLRAGAGTRLTMATLASLGVFPLLYAWAVYPNQGDAQLEEWIRWGGNAYGALPVLIAVAAIGLVSFAAAFGVHLFHESLRRRFLEMRAFEKRRRDRRRPDRAERDDDWREPPREPAPQRYPPEERRPVAPPQEHHPRASQAPASEGPPRRRYRKGELPRGGFRWEP